MPTLPHSEIASLLAPYAPVPPPVVSQMSLYLDLLLKWNAKTNLTAIRDPREIVRRHFGESLFTASHLPPCRTLLDFGSGAGFPGVPIQCLCPEIQVTLAESQNKKVAFLRETARVLGLSCEIWPGRVESMDSHRRFDAVTLRAVDDPDAARREAILRLIPGGTLASLTSRPAAGSTILRIPESTETVLELMTQRHG